MKFKNKAKENKQTKNKEKKNHTKNSPNLVPFKANNQTN